MTTGHATSDMAGRIAQLRAEIGDEPLVSHAQDPVGAEIGGAVFERVPWDSNHAARGGTVVERWCDEDAELHVTTVKFRGRTGNVEVVTARLALSDCTPPEPYDAYRCWRALRLLWAALGQRSGANGPPLSDYEVRWEHWCQALLHAVLDRMEATG